MATLFLEQMNHWIYLAIDNVKLGLYDTGKGVILSP